MKFGLDFSISCQAPVTKAKKAVKKCFTIQIEREKFALVEILSPCPTCWRLSPLDSLQWMEEKMIPSYPLGVIKDEASLPV